jgi:hypothetical protein
VTEASPVPWRRKWRRMPGAAASAGGRARPTLMPRCWSGRARCSPATRTRAARQIKEFRRRVGGIGHIIMMTRQGLGTHAEAEKSFTLAAREVLPQLQDLAPLDPEEAAWLARRAAAAK